MGLAAGSVCFYATEIVKQRFSIDDSLDVFAVHGVGGIIGILLVSVLATGFFGGSGLGDGVTVGGQLWVQAVGVAATVIWSVVMTYVIVKVTSALTGGARVDDEDEIVGLDLASHGERGYDL